VKGPNRKIRPFLFLWVFLGWVGATLVAEPDGAVPKSPPVEFYSFINVNYRHLPKLRGWQTTRDLVADSLNASGLVGQRHRVDGTSQDLRTFLERLPVPARGTVQVIYLASQQSADGAWEFTNKERVSWKELLSSSRKLAPEQGMRIVLLDSCYARVAADLPAWKEWASLTLCAAEVGEVTWEIDFDKRQPRDFRVRLRDVWNGLQRYYGDKKWSHRVSFMGAIWLETQFRGGNVPSGIEGWNEFFLQCVQNAEEFQRMHGRGFASTLSVVTGFP
jgi:hypothetical protein